MRADEPGRGSVLLSVRLVGFADVDAVVHRTGMAAAAAREHLDLAAAAGLLVERRSPDRGWSITDEGRRTLGEWLHREIAAGDAGAVVDEAYRRFGSLNSAFLEACRRWQVIDTSSGPRPNRHDDPEYDADAVVTIIGTVDELDAVVLVPLARSLSRFDRYRRRFAAARQHVLADEHDYLTRPLVDSFHTIWFEVHEDLLATTGRSRSTERDAR